MCFILILEIAVEKCPYLCHLLEEHCLCWPHDLQYSYQIAGYPNSNSLLDYPAQGCL